MKSAVVTGGAGFIGEYVVRALEGAGYHVGVVGSSSRTDPLTAERLAAIDDGCELIVHCAGGSSVGASVAQPSAEHAKSVPPFAALLDHVQRRSPHTRVVLLSSAAVYGAAAQVPTPETLAPSPVSPYGAHKLECEQLCTSYGRSHGVASVIVRLFSVYGPGLRKQLLWDACVKARSGDVTFGGTGDEERDWLHVRDAANLLLVASQQASADVPIFNGGSGRGVRVRDVVGQIYRDLRAGTPVFTGQTRAGDPQRYVADITSARSLGWEPQIDREAGIADYVRWFQEQT